MLRRVALWVVAFLAGPAAWGEDPSPPVAGGIRVATYNVAMYRDRAGQLAEELRSGGSRQAGRIAEVVQRVRPDVLLLCEIDYAPEDDPPRVFAEVYAAKPQAVGLSGVLYPHRFSAPVNTGVPSGLDLDNDGRTDGPADAWGFGRYPGQYGMAVLSRWPIDRAATRTFRRLRWSEQPGALPPVDPRTSLPYHPESVWRRLRLPSKSFWDVVVDSPGGPLHLLCSHPTPPVFDGPEDRNGRRNADEIKLVARYASGSVGARFEDDQGRRGGLPSGERFVILGDLNADPADGDGRVESIGLLLALASDPAPRSEGAVAASRRRPDLNAKHRGDPAEDTADFSGDGQGNLRVDYALPSRGLRVLGGGVYWPQAGEPGSEAAEASDHRLVWVDVASPDR